QLAWLKRNGEPYPVLWLNISRVADYFYRYYNHWTPRGETGYVDADCTRLPNSTWLGYQSVIEEQLQKHGFELMSKETASEETPFILERDYDSIPDDDPRWAD